MAKVKRYAVLITIIILIAAAVFSYFKIQEFKSTLKEAEQNKQKSQMFETLSKSIEEERSRCQAFVSQEQGEFGQFEYCKNFLDWSNSTATSPQ